MKRYFAFFAILLALPLLVWAANPGDVRINEVMYDDTASTDVEWVELYNTTGSPINISGWWLGDCNAYPGPSTEGYLVVPTTTMLDSYLVVCLADLPGITGEVICAQTGSWILGNSGDNLALYDAASGGTLIDGSLTAQYPDDAPTNGGYSIEKINQNGAWSSSTADWDASTNVFAATGRYRFCTPGFKNSVATGDLTKPTISSVVALSATSVDVLFSEAVDQTTAETESNYSIDGGIGNPSLATRDGTNQALVHLTVSTLTGYTTYTLTVNNVKDLANNTILPNSTKQFVYNEEIGDIIITEFMANPGVATDANGEWFEIYNNTGSQINLNGWIIKDNFGADTIEGDKYIASNDYFVFCANETLAVNGGVPTDYDYVYGTTGWGLSFSNSGDDRITVWDNIGQMQDSVPFNSTAWGVLNGASKQLRNLTDDNTVAANWCDGQNAWPGSAGDLGTPGGMNSCGDTTRPTIVSATAQSATLVDVLFSELVTIATCEVEGNYSIDNGIGNPSLATRDGTNPALVHLTVSTLTEDLLYTILVSNVADSAGNPVLPNSSAQFLYHDYAGDVIITEVMPNPAAVFDQNGEWFEIYNTTLEPLNLSGWIIHDNYGADTIDGDHIVASHDYFVFCVNDTLATNGGVPADYNYIYSTGAGGLSLSNTTDVPYILTPQGVVIDCVRYASANWPFGNGSSMQLKDVTLNNDDPTNWCASANAWIGSAGDKGTPGAACDCSAPDTVALTICQARLESGCGVPAYLDTLIRVKGVVSFADTCMRTAFLQDGGCGIALYGWPVSTEFPPPVSRLMRPGDSIEVTGYLTLYAGLAEIASAHGYTPVAVLLDSNKTVTMTDLDCALISSVADAGDDSCSGEDYESEKIVVSGVDFVATGTFSPGDMNYAATCPAGGTIQVRIDSCSAFLDAPIPDGAVNVVGILGQYDWTACYCHGYQIIPIAFLPVACSDPVALTVYRIATTDSVRLDWSPGVDQTCNCYRIYASTDPFAAFPGVGWTQVGCVCNQTTYSYAPPISSTSKLFYLVTAVPSCP
jgi:hypothetical protein